MRATHLHPFLSLTCALLVGVSLGGCPSVDPTAGDAARAVPKLDAPRRTSPRAVDDIYPNQVRLAWSKSAGASSYVLYFGTDSNPPLMATIDTNSFVVRELPGCTKHYWRVVAVNDAKEAISSPTWAFTTSCD